MEFKIKSLFFIILLSLSSCTDSGVKSDSLSKNSIIGYSLKTAELNIDDKFRLMVIGHYADGKTQDLSNKKWTYALDREGVLSVTVIDEYTVYAKAIAEGEVTIRVTLDQSAGHNGKTASGVIKVKSSVDPCIAAVIPCQETKVINGIVKQYYKIYTQDQLSAIAPSLHEVSGNFSLKQDLDLSGKTGPLVISFNSGNFDGEGHKLLNKTGAPLFGLIKTNASVSNLIIENFHVTQGEGIFAGTVEGTIDNLTIKDSSFINQNNNAGAIAGNLISGKIINSNVVNSSVIANSAGGIAGSAFLGSKIVNASVSYSTISAGNVGGAGGIVAYAKASDITGSTTIGSSVSTSGDYAGGIAGNLSESSSIQNSSTINSQISSRWYSGGTVGFMEYGFIDGASVTQSKVQGSMAIGGLIGRNIYATISQSFVSDSEIIGSQLIGAFSGLNQGTIESSCSVSNTLVNGVSSGL